MRVFTLDEKYNVVCKSENTNSGFRHTARLHMNGQEIFKTKMCYVNRTWESYEFESVLLKIVEDYFEHNQKDNFKNLVIGSKENHFGQAFAK